MEWSAENYIVIMSFTLSFGFYVLCLPDENRAIVKKSPILSILWYIGLVVIMSLVSISFRLALLVIIMTAIGIWHFKLKWVQSTWLIFFNIVAVAIPEAIGTIIIEVILVDVFSTFSYRVYLAVYSLLGYTLMVLMAALTRKHIKNYISRIGTQPKGYAVTLSVAVLGGSVVLVLYNLLMLGDGGAYNISPTVYWVFFLAGIFFIFLGAFLIDRHYKRLVEMERLKKQMTDMERNFGKMPFETNVELDLMSSHFGLEIIHRYDVSKMIYKGANSQIYQLVGKKDLKLYTLKAMDHTMGVQYDMEGLKKISGNGLAHIIEWGVGETFSYSIKQYFEGQDLFSLVDTCGPLSEDRILSIVEQLKSILTHLHQQDPPIVFRDVKPSNIIIGEGDAVTLVDVESARRMKSEGNSDTIIIGTRGYAPPEQYGFSQTGPYSDIYAVGATAYFMVTGETPKYGDITPLLAENTRATEALKMFIQNAMQFDPNNRSW